MKKRLLSVTLLLIMTAICFGCVGKKDGNRKPWEGTSVQKETSEGEDSTATSEPVVASEIWDDSAVDAKIKEINMLIDNYYYFDVDREKQEEALYDGIMEGLDDPYSVYYTKDEYEQLQEDSSGEYVGVGAVVTQDENMKVSIVRPIRNSPAEEAGLKAGDILVEVDGVEIVDQELSLVVDMIRGEEGTVAHLKIYRQGEPDYLEFDVTRRVVENYTVDCEMVEDNIGYVSVTQFNENTSDEFKEAIEDCISKGAEAMVIDLRDNPGGMLTSVVDMCDYIMDDGIIVSTKDKKGNVMQEFKDTGKHNMTMPMVVLVNGNSASASEIFAGAMKDTGKAVIVGTTTFGKGIVQSVIPLSDGTAVKITIAKYFTPNGNDIHQIGVEPDVVVELEDGLTNAVNLEREKDTQLKEGLQVLHKKLKK